MSDPRPGHRARPAEVDPATDRTADNSPADNTADDSTAARSTADVDLRLRPEAAPEFLGPLLRAVSAGRGAVLPARERRLARPDPAATSRPAAVLMLFGADAATGGPDVLLLERAASLREHAGQVAFPGGGTEPADRGPVDTALREAAEETGLDPAGVVPLAVLAPLHVPPSGFLVHPVLAHWADPVAVRAVDAGETAAVARLTVADLTDPANRVRIRHSSGYVGPAFTVGGLLVWGFTGALLSALLDLGGWARPWDTARVLTLDEGWSVARSATVRRSPA